MNIAGNAVEPCRPCRPPRLAWLGAALCLAWVPAHAQFDAGRQANLMHQHELMRKQSTGKDGDDRRQQALAPAELPVTTRFRRASTLARQVTTAFVDGYRPVHGQRRTEVMRLVASGEALEALLGQIRDHGLDPDDAADVMTFHFAVNWAIANGSTVPGDHLAELREMLSPRILERITEAGTERRDLQRLADTHALATVVRSMEYVALLREGDEPSAAAYRDAVHRDFRTREGIDLRTTRL